MSFVIYTITSTEILDDATALANGRKLARDSTGRLWCVYSHEDGGLYRISASYSDNNGKTWIEEEIASSASWNYGPAIAIDSNNILHVVWIGRGLGTFPTKRQILYRQRTAVGWQTVELVTDINSHQTWYPAIAVDSLDNVHVVWTGYGWGVNTGNDNVQYRQRTVSGWQAQEGVTDIDGGVLVIQFNPSIAIDSNDNIHVAWDGRGWGVNDGIRNMQYRLRTAGSWQSQEAITDEASENYTCSIAVDSLDNVHLVWYGAFGGDPVEQVHYRERTGAGWGAVEDVTSFPAPSESTLPSIALDKGNNIYVVWSGESLDVDDPTWNNIGCRRKTTTGWQPIETLTNRVWDQSYPSLLWAKHGPITNILPSGNYSFVFTGIEDGLVYKVELFSTVRRWKGNIHVDQLIYQHAERMER